MDRANIEKYLKEFEAKADKAYDQYQVVGSATLLKTYEKNQELADALRIALENDADKNCSRDRRKNNIVSYGEKLIDKTYTKDEVVDILLKTAYWG